MNFKYVYVLCILYNVPMLYIIVVVVSNSSSNSINVNTQTFGRKTDQGKPLCLQRHIRNSPHTPSADHVLEPPAQKWGCDPFQKALQESPELSLPHLYNGEHPQHIGCGCVCS